MTLEMIVLSLVFFGMPVIAIILIILFSTTKEEDKIMENKNVAFALNEIKSFKEVQNNFELLLDSLKNSDIKKSELFETINLVL